MYRYILLISLIYYTYVSTLIKSLLFSIHYTVYLYMYINIIYSSLSYLYAYTYNYTDVIDYNTMHSYNYVVMVDEWYTQVVCNTWVLLGCYPLGGIWYKHINTAAKVSKYHDRTLINF